MKDSIRIYWLMLAATVVTLTVCGLIWLASSESSAPVEPVDPVEQAPGPAALRIGLIPERNIFEQRRRYRALADYLVSRLNAPVELVTESSYLGMLADFEDDRVDVAFLGSLVATMAMRQHDARVVLKPELAGSVTTYHGVLFVRGDSSIQTIEDLAGQSIAMVKATTAADLFPTWTLSRHGMLDGAEPPVVRWVGTHDDAVREVMAGRVDAGAAKNLRLDDYLAEHPEASVRRLEQGPEVPNNALIVSARLDPALVDQLVEILSTMHESEEGRATLEAFGARRFVPCSAEEYRAIDEMTQDLGDLWSGPGVGGQASVMLEMPLGVEP